MFAPYKSHLKEYFLPDISDEEWGYIAGLIDGEGHVRMYPVKDTDRYGFQISISQSKKNNGEELLNKMRDLLQVGAIHKSRDSVIEYNIGQRLTIYKILKRIRPMLIVKKDIADKIITYMEQTYSQPAIQG